MKLDPRLVVICLTVLAGLIIIGTTVMAIVGVNMGTVLEVFGFPVLMIITGFLGNIQSKMGHVEQQTNGAMTKLSTIVAASTVDQVKLAALVNTMSGPTSEGEQ